MEMINKGKAQIFPVKRTNRLRQARCSRLSQVIRLSVQHAHKALLTIIWAEARDMHACVGEFVSACVGAHVRLPSGLGANGTRWADAGLWRRGSPSLCGVHRRSVGAGPWGPHCLCGVHRHSARSVGAALSVWRCMSSSASSM
jgi:hypothetical protein